jgi:hypothetical protein
MGVSLLLLLPASLLGTGCGSDSPPNGPSSPVETLRERRATRFALADFVKPRVDGTSEVDPYLAPVLYLEAPQDAPIGTALVDGSGRLAVDSNRPVVYCAEERIELAGRERSRLTFVWFRDLPAPRAQGVRLVLDRDGLPAIVEVLADGSGLRPVYVTTALEAAAAEEQGPALPGRTFAIEGQPDRAGPLTVVGTVDTPSAPLGPFVYQARDGNDVIALHCRCSPSQVDAFRETVEYELVPLALLAGIWPSLESGGFVPTEQLERGLRLPSGF